MMRGRERGREGGGGQGGREGGRERGRRGERDEGVVKSADPQKALNE